MCIKQLRYHIWINWSRKFGSVKKHCHIVLIVLTVFAVVAHAEMSIPAGDVMRNQIFHGIPSSFSNPAEIDVDAVILSTPEFQKIKKKRIRKGTGKYWILRSNATDRAHRAIQTLAARTKFDLIANSGYLGDLPTPIKCAEITKQAIKILRNG